MPVDPLSVPDHRRYNHTIHFQRELLAEVPDTAHTAIDAGCGEGLASRTLAAAGLTVVGIDEDAPSIDRARSQDTTRITYVVGDVLTTDLTPADVVYSGAMLHHMDIREGLTRLASWVAPGGRLCIVGAARSTWRDLPREVVSSLADKVFTLVRGSWKHGSPTVWPPPHTYAQVRDAVEELLPGARYRSRILWRYTIVWDRPAG